MSVSATVAADKRRRALLLALEENDRHWPESLHDRVMRLRIRVADQFAEVAREHCPPPASGAQEANAAIDNSTTFSRVMNLIQADVLHAIQQLADELPRGIYQEQIQSAMRREFDQKMSQLQLQHQQLMQQQLAAAQRRLNGGNASFAGTLASETALQGEDSLHPSPAASPSRRRQTSNTVRPASAGAAGASAFAVNATFEESQLRHVYTQLHEARTAAAEERSKVDALRAFCIRKDAAVEYIRETLLHEVVVLKEQLRRQEQDPTFVSDFVTLFDCWKVLEGDDPAGAGGGGSAEAVRQAKKELQAEAARVQHQYQLALRRKDDEIAELQAKAAAAPSSSPLDKKKSFKKSKGDEIHEQFMQLTADMAKKDVAVADLTEEIKQLQTEVAIAQQLAKSTRDQLNRSNVDMEQAMAIRDREIVAKSQVIEELERDLQRLRNAMSDDETKRRIIELQEAKSANTQLEQRCVSAEAQCRQFEVEVAQVRAQLACSEQELVRVKELNCMSVDERQTQLTHQLKDLGAVCEAKDARLVELETIVAKLETEVDNVSSRLETTKFENTKLRIELRTQDDRKNFATSSVELADLPEEVSAQDDLPRIAAPSVNVMGLMEGSASAPCSDEDPQAKHGSSSADSSGVAWALERRLAKEVSIAHQLRVENEALKEELRQASRNEPPQAPPTLNVDGSNGAVATSPRLKGSSKGPKSPRKMSPEAAPSAALEEVQVLKQQLRQSESEVCRLRQELEAQRAHYTNGVASALLTRPPATFAYHVDSPDSAALQPLSQPAPTVALESFVTRKPKDGLTSRAVPSTTAPAAVIEAQQVVGSLKPRVLPTADARQKMQAPQRARPASLNSSNAPTRRPIDADISPFENDLDAGSGLTTPIRTSKGLGVGVDPEAYLHYSMQADVTPLTSPPHEGLDAVDKMTMVAEVRALNRSEEPPSARNIAALSPGEAVGLKSVADGSLPCDSQLVDAHEQISVLRRELQHLHRSYELLQKEAAETEFQLAQENEHLSNDNRCLTEALEQASRDTQHRQPQRTTPLLAEEVASHGFDKTGTPVTTPPASLRPTDAQQRPSRNIAGDESSTESVATQTDLTYVQLSQLIASHSSPTPVVSRPPTAGATTSRHGSAHQGSRSERSESPQHAAITIATADSVSAPANVLATPVQRVFSAHRRAVHTAGSSVSVQTRVDEPQFYIAGGEIVSSCEETNVGGTTTVTNALPATKMFRRPTGSAGQRSSTVERLTTAVSVAKGLSDVTKARSATPPCGAGAPDTTADGGIPEPWRGLTSVEVSGVSCSDRPAKKPAPSVLRLIERPQTPAVLSGTPELSQLAMEHLQLPRGRMSPVPTAPTPQLQTAAALSAQPAEVVAVSAVVAASHHQLAVPTPTDLPQTVDCRDHVTQVLFGAGGEKSALRGVKEKIKQNINVEKFIGRVLNGGGGGKK